MVDYEYGVNFFADAAPVVTVLPDPELHTLEYYIGCNYAHMLTREELMDLLEELGVTGVPRNKPHIDLVESLLIYAQVEGPAKERMMNLARAKQRRPRRKAGPDQEESGGQKSPSPYPGSGARTQGP